MGKGIAFQELAYSTQLIMTKMIKKRCILFMFIGSVCTKNPQKYKSKSSEVIKLSIHKSCWHFSLVQGPSSGTVARVHFSLVQGPSSGTVARVKRVAARPKETYYRYIIQHIKTVFFIGLGQAFNLWKSFLGTHKKKFKKNLSV